MQYSYNDTERPRTDQRNLTRLLFDFPVCKHRNMSEITLNSLNLSSVRDKVVVLAGKSQQVNCDTTEGF